MSEPKNSRRDEPAFLAVGHLNKPHGTKGELFVWSLTDHPESHFAPGVILQVAGPDEEKPDLVLPPVRVQSARPFRGGFLLQTSVASTRQDAELFKGRYLLRPMAEIDPLEPGEFFYHQLLGCVVVTASGQEVGEVTEVYELRPAHLLEINGPAGTIHIPLNRHMVQEVDIEAGRIIIDPPDGLLDQIGDEELGDAPVPDVQSDSADG